MMPPAAVFQGSRVVWGWGKAVKVFPLPTTVVESGHNAFIRHLHTHLNTMPYAIHATFQLKHNLFGKMARFRETGLWMLDPPEYYTQGNFLTYDNAVASYIESAASVWEKAAGKPMAYLHKHLLATAFQRQVSAVRCEGCVVL